MWQVRAGQASEQRQRRAPHPWDVLRKHSEQRSSATSCDGLRTPGEGIRIEELMELSHHSLVQYRLPSTGELVPLLHIAPSKADVERLLVISPELADVLAASGMAVYYGAQPRLLTQKLSLCELDESHRQTAVKEIKAAIDEAAEINALGVGIAVYFLATGVNGLQLLGAADYVQQLFYGAALIIAVVLSRQLRRRA